MRATRARWRCGPARCAPGSRRSRAPACRLDGSVRRPSVGAPVGVVEGAVVEGPGEVPLGLTVLTRQGTFTDEPAEGAGGVAMSAVGGQRQACRWLPCCCGSSTVTVAHCSWGTPAVSACAGCRGATWIGCGQGARPTQAARLRDGVGRRLGDLTRQRTPNVLETWTTYGSRRASRPARKVGFSPYAVSAVTTPCATRAARARSTNSKTAPAWSRTPPTPVPAPSSVARHRPPTPWADTPGCRAANGCVGRCHAPSPPPGSSPPCPTRHNTGA